MNKMVGSFLTPVRYFDEISPKGLKRFGDAYDVRRDVLYAQAIIVRNSRIKVDNFPKLLAVARAGAGVDKIDVERATELGIAVFNTEGENAQSVKEILFAALESNACNLREAERFVNDIVVDEAHGDFKSQYEAGKSAFVRHELRGQTLGIIGINGHIGRLVAKGGVGRGMRVVGYDKVPAIKKQKKIRRVRSVEQVLNKADVLTVHVPETPETRHMIGREQIVQMKDGCILINYAREDIIDTAAVLEALDSGKLGAYLTDFPTEELCRHGKVRCTPHLGASTYEAEERCATVAVLLLKAYLELCNVTRSVNIPANELPPPDTGETGVTRLGVIHQNVPNMLGRIDAIIGHAEINIRTNQNKTKGRIGYYLVDLEGAVPHEVIEEIERLKGILRVRAIRFPRQE